MFKKNGSVLRKHQEKYYLMSSNNILYEVNEEAARIFSLCNGDVESDIEKIIEKIAGFYNDTDYDVVRTNVIECLNNLQGLGLITIHNTERG